MPQIMGGGMGKGGWFFSGLLMRRVHRSWARAVVGTACTNGRTSDIVGQIERGTEAGLVVGGNVAVQFVIQY